MLGIIILRISVSPGHMQKQERTIKCGHHGQILQEAQDRGIQQRGDELIR